MSLLQEKIKNIFNPRDDFDFGKNMFIKVGIGVLTLILIILLLPSYKNIDTKYQVGTIWSSEDLIAPFSFPIYKDDADYENEKNEVIKNVSPVFEESGRNSDEVSNEITGFFSRLSGILQTASALEKNDDGGVNSEKLDDRKDELGIEFSPDEWRKIFLYYKNELGESVGISYQSLRTQLISYLTELSQNKIISINKSEISSPKITITTRNVKVQELEDVSEVFDESQIQDMVTQKFSALVKDNELGEIVKKIADSYVKPNLIFDKELTDLEINNRIEQIPKTIGIVRENERIISKHDPIARQTKLKLDSYKKVRLEKIGVQDYFVQYIGKALMVAVLLIVFTFFLLLIRPRVYKDNRMLILISSLIILQCFFAYLSLKLIVNAPVELLIFVPVTSILLTIIFDSRLSFYTTVIICFLVAAVRGGDFTIAFISFCGSVLAIFSVRDVKNRSQIFRSFFFILVGNSVAILAIGLDRTAGTSEIINRLLFGGINAIMSPVIAYGLLIFYERAFKITTDLTLVELSDFNHPLLKELSSKAPGTFHHSIIMGNLSEAAADAIGASGILARVGCYYHDVGKTLRPEYYIENQMDKSNVHEVLNPNISAKLIISHIKDGVELAKKYKLPQEIIDFIPMHHGTTLASYFYSKAKDQADVSKEEISDYMYRYPGPKPQTKETGIVMLADSVEAASRTIDDPTPQKLENKIDGIIKQRFMEGELDECDLTLKDLSKIKQSFLKILVGIHHHRIKYPENNKKKEETVEEQ